MPADSKGRTYRQFIFIYRATLVIFVGLGVYDVYTNTTTGGVFTGHYTGTTTVSYGGYGLLIMAAALLLGQFLLWIISKLRKQDQ